MSEFEDNGYPESFYRGLTNKDCRTQEGFIAAGAFLFDEYDPGHRNDEYRELSINWKDDSGSLTRLLNQHKPHSETKQFKEGCCEVSVAKMKLVLKAHIDQSYFSYERRKIEADEENDIEANPYHGNLLMKHGVSNGLRKQIENSLACIAVPVITNNI